MEKSARRVASAHDLGDCISAVRVAAGLRQQEAAALCGVSATFLNGLELGKRPKAQFDAILRVCQGLGIAIELEPPEPLPDDAPTSLKRGRRKLLL